MIAQIYYLIDRFLLLERPIQGSVKDHLFWAAILVCDITMVSLTATLAVWLAVTGATE